MDVHPEPIALASAPYRELLGVGCHPDTRLVTDDPQSWGKWWNENRDTFAVEMPTPVMTVPVGRVAFDSATGQPWQIRVARVEAPGTATYSPRALML